MRLLRLLLMLTVLVIVFDAVMAAYVCPPILILYAAIFVRAKRQAFKMSAYGTARWACSDDIPHMLEGNGIILGYLVEDDS